MKYVKLKKVANYPTGKLNSNAACENGIYPFFTCSHDIFKIESYAYDGEYVLLGGNNATGDFPIFYYNGKFEAYQRTYLIQPIDKEKYSTRYLYYAIGEKLSLMQKNASGTATKFLTKPILDNISIPDFPFDKQKTIASILCAYDNLIENNNRRIRLLEQMAENLYKEWFVRFRFPGHEKVEFKNGLPKGWKIEKLGNVANISTGKCNREDAEEEGLYPLFDRSQEIKKSSEWLKDCEAIIVPGEGTSFIPRYYWGKFNLHQRCYCVEPKFENTGKYLFYVLMLNRKYFLSVATGATVPSLRYNNFAKMSFVLPEKTLCEKYNGIVTTYFEEINSLKASNQILSRQRDLLLPRLMSGKLEVKV